MIGKPPATACARRSTSSARSRSGAPDIPPGSFASGDVAPKRPTVVLVTISPARSRSRAMPTIASSAPGSRSGAILTRIGLAGS